MHVHVLWPLLHWWARGGSTAHMAVTTALASASKSLLCRHWLFFVVARLRLPFWPQKCLQNAQWEWMVQWFPFIYAIIGHWSYPLMSRVINKLLLLVVLHSRSDIWLKAAIVKKHLPFTQYIRRGFSPVIRSGNLSRKQNWVHRLSKCITKSQIIKQDLLKIFRKVLGFWWTN